MASESIFLTKLINGRRFRFFMVTAAKNRTPRTRCNLCLNNGVSYSDSTVFVAFSNVATSPCVIIAWLASNCVDVPILGGSTLCVCSSCMQISGSTRLTQTSVMSSLLSDVVCVAVVLQCGSFRAVCVVLVVSLCLGLAVVFYRCNSVFDDFFWKSRFRSCLCFLLSRQYFSGIPYVCCCRGNMNLLLRWFF